ncbi:MAG: SRPBCC family protein [Acidimicrobiales bacterium]
MTGPAEALPDRGWSYEVKARTSAPPESVWALISQADSWKEWSFLTRSWLLREGSPERDGIGALRRFAVGPFGSQEEVVEFDPPFHLAYVAHRGLPVRSYRADILLIPDGTGTVVVWTGSLEPLRPGTGWAALVYTRAFIRVFARQLVRHADRQAKGPH